EAPGREASRGEGFVEGQRQLVDRVRELVGVPAVLVVAAVDVDAAEGAERDRTRDLVVEAVAGERRVVRLEVQAVLGSQIVALEESDDRRDVVVVLVLRRLLWLRLDEERALEADPVLVFRDERKEPCELNFFLPEIGIQQRLVALAPAAVATSTPAVSQGRSNVPTPKTSEPGQLKECQRHTAMRSWSSIRLPSTSRSGWYTAYASGSEESGPPYVIRAGTSPKKSP